jgi:hypothetical protein
MPTLTDLEVADLVAGTLYEMGPPNFQQIAQNLPEYEVMGKWLRKDKVTVSSGVGIQRALMTKLAGAASHVGLAEIDDVDIPDLMSKINIPWRHATTNWAYERRELLMNRGKSLVTNVVKPRRTGAMIDLAEILEAKAWASPGAANVVDPYGIPYYVVMNASTGFNGGAPSGHSTVAGINPTTTPKWANYTDTFGAITKADFVKSLRTAHRNIKWKSPVTIKDFRRGAADRYRCYTDEENLSDIEDVGESQNENLGRDIASMDGTIVFRKHPIVWVPQLDSTPAAANPFYMIDHSTFYPVVLKGDFLRETKPEKKGDQHNVYVVFTDLTYNFVCIDRRRSAAFYKVL